MVCTIVMLTGCSPFLRIVKAMKKKKTEKKSTRKKATKKKKVPNGSPTRRRDKDGLSANMRAFLVAFEEVQSMTDAARISGVNRTMPYEWKQRSSAFVEAFETVNQRVDDRKRLENLETIDRVGDPERGFDTEVIEQEQVAKVVNGQPVVDEEGKQVFWLKSRKVKREKKFSITALVWRANNLNGNPAIQRMEITGKNGGPIEGKVSLEAFREMALLGEKLKEEAKKR